MSGDTCMSCLMYIEGPHHIYLLPKHCPVQCEECYDAGRRCPLVRLWLR